MATLGAITLPDDLQWVDEFDWLPVSQQVEVSTGGSLIVEEFGQAKGRPITLEGRMEGNVGFAMIRRDVLLALQALAATPRTTALLLTLDDGRTFNVLFRHAGEAALVARPLKHIVPAEAADLYSITIRLMEV